MKKIIVIQVLGRILLRGRSIFEHNTHAQYSCTHADNYAFRVGRGLSIAQLRCVSMRVNGRVGESNAHSLS